MALAGLYVVLAQPGGQTGRRPSRPVDDLHHHHHRGHRHGRPSSPPHAARPHTGPRPRSTPTTRTPTYLCAPLTQPADGHLHAWRLSRPSTTSATTAPSSSTRSPHSCCRTAAENGGVLGVAQAGCNGLARASRGSRGHAVSGGSVSREVLPRRRSVVVVPGAASVGPRARSWVFLGLALRRRGQLVRKAALRWSHVLRLFG